MSPTQAPRTTPETRLLIAGATVFALLAGATALLSPSLVTRFYPLLPDRGASWYYWQLPSPTTLTRVTAWASYAIHQIVIWITLGLAMKRSLDGTHYDSRSRGSISRFNIAAMTANLLFVALHLVQTYLWYDGLAQDVPIWTSQGSVIVMLVLILFMELPHRGLFWGRRVSPPRLLYGFVRRWHGVYIAWAITYTFWFHPMDGNWGLLSGFVYMFVLFIQLAMFNTRTHMSRAWVVFLEFFVVVHATLITVYKENPIWPMFMFGFLVMFVLTQMHELSWARRMRWPVLGILVASIVLIYGLVRGFEHIYEVTFIPVALYGGTLGLLGIGWLADRIVVVGDPSKP